jgi:hypothetical protein
MLTQGLPLLIPTRIRDAALEVRKLDEDAGMKRTGFGLAGGRLFLFL